ncbi:MAG TPA: NAD(P)-binding domain-containing protein [Candidatus Dormibacteraeota bacterium]|nr:NAD(P)-binding domain-containing protein [Candidatus Dormibacteraeota bacterium]
MKVAVIGAGNIGGTMGGKWEHAGHEVTYGLREPAKKKGAKTIDGALDEADVVLLAVPGSAVAELAREHGKKLEGKVVIDATNNPRAASFNSWHELEKVIPGALLYRAFNIYGWEVFANPSLGGEQADLFYCGPEKDAPVVERLIEDVGVRPVRVGGMDAVDTVDGLLRLWFTLSRSRGRRIAFKLISD